MCKKGLFISVFGLDGIDSNSRLQTIYNFVDGDKIIITTDFNHREKKYFIKPKNGCYHIHVLPYKKNVSLKRVLSHIVFAYKLRKYLNAIKEKPDYIYCTMPTSTAAYVCGRFCKKHNIHYIIDVIDLWPDSLIPVLGRKKYLINWLLYPWRFFTISAYKFADVILGESQKYTFKAHLYNPTVPAYSFYLGIDKNKVVQQIGKSKVVIQKNINEIWIVYAGNLGVSYDFETLIKGVASLNNRFIYRLLFVGDGTKRKNVENLIKNYNVNGYITGYVGYDDLLKYLSYSDIAVNIFCKNTKVVHSYKFNDYVATSCFILNSLPGETADLVSLYKVGLNFDFENNTFDKILLHVLENWDSYKLWKNNNDILIDKVLDKRIVYTQLKKIFEKI